MTTSTAGPHSGLNEPEPVRGRAHPVPAPQERRRTGDPSARTRRTGGRSDAATPARHSRGLGYRALRILLDLVDGAEIPPPDGPYRLALGRVGTMDTQTIHAAVLACAERADVLDPGLNDVHALYHATRDALDGILRDAAGLGPTLRTTALLFTILRGPRLPGLQGERDWIAVACFGSIGAPRSGWEHEAVGLGIFNL